MLCGRNFIPVKGCFVERVQRNVTLKKNLIVKGLRKRVDSDPVLFIFLLFFFFICLLALINSAV